MKLPSELNTGDFVVVREADKDLIKEIINESNSLDSDINLLIANQMSYSLENSDYKEI